MQLSPRLGGLAFDGCVCALSGWCQVVGVVGQFALHFLKPRSVEHQALPTQCMQRAGVHQLRRASSKPVSPSAAKRSHPSSCRAGTVVGVGAASQQNC